MSARSRAEVPQVGAAWLDRAAWLAVAGLVIATGWWRWEFLTGSPYPLGIDGFYYPIQLRAILEDGGLAYPASPLAFWLMAPLAAWLGPIAGAKLGAAIGGALVAVPAFGLGRRLGGRSAGLLAAALAATSAGSFYLSIEFVKQGLGVTVGLFGLWLVARALERPVLGRVAGAAVAVIAAVLTHKMAAALVVAVAVPAIVVEVRARPGAPGARLWLAGALALMVAIGLGAAFPERFVGERDAELAGRLLSAEPRWDLPALAFGRRPLMIGYEAWLAAIVSALSLALAGRAWWRSPSSPLSPRRAELAMAATIALFGLAIAIPWLNVADPQGLPFRLRLVAFVPLALGGAVLVGSLQALLPSRLRTIDLLATAAAAAVVLVQPRARDEGVIVTHPAMVAAVRALDGVVPAGDVVVVNERHIAFMVGWYTRDAVRLRPEAVQGQRRWRLMPLPFIGERSPMARALAEARREPTLEPPRGLHPRHPDGLVLVTEQTWEWLVARLPASSAAHYRAWPIR